MPPGNYQSKPSGPQAAQMPPSSISSVQQHRSSPSPALTPSFTATPQHNQVSQSASPHSISPFTLSQTPTHPVMPQLGSNQHSQNQPSTAPQPPISQYNPSSNALDSQATIGNESNNPFVQSTTMNLSQSSLTDNSKMPTGLQQNYPFGNSSNLPPSTQNMVSRNSQSTVTSQEFRGKYTFILMV